MLVGDVEDPCRQYDEPAWIYKTSGTFFYSRAKGLASLDTIFSFNN